MTHKLLPRLGVSWIPYCMIDAKARGTELVRLCPASAFVPGRPSPSCDPWPDQASRCIRDQVVRLESRQFVQKDLVNEIRWSSYESWILIIFQLLPTSIEPFLIFWRNCQPVSSKKTYTVYITLAVLTLDSYGRTAFGKLKTREDSKDQDYGP